MDFKLKKSELNFRVYTAPSFPATGTENDICIKSEVPMTNWVMSPDKPSGAPRSDGDVWIQYSATGDTFNVLKSSTMMIAAVTAWQYVNGAWVYATAKIYQNGAWNHAGNYYIYYRGNFANSGGFAKLSYEQGIKFNADHIWLQGGDDIASIAMSLNPIPLGYKKMVIVGEVVASNGTVCFQHCGLMSKDDIITTVAEWGHNPVGLFVETVDISTVDVTAHGFVKIRVARSDLCIGKIYEIYLTK